MCGKRNRYENSIKTFLVIAIVFISTSCTSYSDDKKLSKKFYEEGIGYFNRKEYQKALDLFNKSLESYSFDNAPVYNMIGLTYKEMKNFDNGMTWFEKAIQSDPNFWASYSYIGDIYKDKGEYDKAIMWYVKSKEVNPMAEILYMNLCNIFIEIGDIEKAVKECKDGIEKLAPYTSELHIKLGDIYAEKKLYEQALMEWNAAKQDPYYSKIYENQDPAGERIRNIKLIQN